MYEYDPKSYSALYSHVILLSDQHHQCKGDEILRGELEVILTAMRNRAIQPKCERNEDDDDYNNTIIDTSEEALQFPNEHRFPVGVYSIMPVSFISQSYGRHYWLFWISLGINGLNNASVALENALCLYVWHKTAHPLFPLSELGETEYCHTEHVCVVSSKCPIARNRARTDSSFGNSDTKRPASLISKQRKLEHTIRSSSK